MPDSQLGTFMYTDDAPQTKRTTSLKNRIRPKVASTWSRWSRWYRLASTRRSISSPSSSVPGIATSAAARKEPSKALKPAAAKYAPIMYSDPCARFTTFMMPNTSVSPADSRNSSTPSCSPLSSWVKNRPVVMVL